MVDTLFAIKYLKLFFYNEGKLELASNFREVELDLINNLDSNSIMFGEKDDYPIKDMTSLTRNQVNELRKIIENKDLQMIKWYLVEDSTLLRLTREIKLNKIFKDT
jgi:hypothetical protein